MQRLGHLTPVDSYVIGNRRWTARKRNYQVINRYINEPNLEKTYCSLLRASETCPAQSQASSTPARAPVPSSGTLGCWAAGLEWQPPSRQQPPSHTPTEPERLVLRILQGRPENDRDVQGYSTSSKGPPQPYTHKKRLGGTSRIRQETSNPY